MPEEYCRSLADLLERQFGVRTDYAINPLVADVDIAVTQIFGANPKRLGFMIMNLSANTVYIAPDQQVAAARGIMLVANGGATGLIWNEDFEMVCLPWWGTATANNSAVISIELFISG
jgi:hypothetical protein